MLNKFRLAFFTFILLSCCFCFADDALRLLEEPVDPTHIEVIKGQIISDYLKKAASVTIEYMPAHDEARFIYTCPSALFEQSNAMLAIKECVSSFIKDRGYYFYTYLKADDTRYANNGDSAVYTSYIKLLH